MHKYTHIKFKFLLSATLVAFVFFACVGPAVFAAPNSQINYQGKLTNSSNIAVADAGYQMEFSLYTASTSGTAVWTETHTGANEVTVQNGLFSVMLGSITSLASVNFNQTLYLGVTIEADAEMSPRKVLGTVPAAFVAENANTVGGVASTSLVRNDQTNTVTASSSNTILSLVQNGIGKILSVFAGAYEAFTISSSGNVGIGSSTPSTRLSVVGNSYFGGNVTATGTIAVAGTATFATTTISSSTITTLNLVNSLPVSSGGTGLNTFSTGDLIFASGANTLASRTIGSTGSVLSVVGGVPTWSATSTLGFSSSFTTSAQLASLLSDEAGTGNAVFSNAPTFTGLSTLDSASTTNFTASNFAGIGTTTRYGTETLGLGGQLALNGNSITNTSGSTQALSFSSASNLTYTGLSGGTVAFSLVNSSASNGSTVSLQFRSSSILAAGINSDRESSNDNNLVFFTRGGGALSERMRINPNGNISIGTTSSSSRLTVDGTLAIFGTSTLATTTITNLTLAQALLGTSGGTGLSTIAQNQILIGGAGNTWTQMATSSLGLGNGTFLGLNDTADSYIANAIPFATSTANQLIFSNKFQFNGQHLGVGGANLVSFSGASTTLGASLTLDGFLGSDSTSNRGTEIIMRSSGNSISSTGGTIANYNSTYTTSDKRTAQVVLSREDADNTNPNGYVAFSTVSLGVFAERLRLTSVGALGLRDSTPEFGIESLATSSLGYFGITNVSDGDIFTINTIGNVGIGTTSPASKLDVWGDFRVGTSSVPSLFVSAASNFVGVGTTTKYGTEALGLGGQLALNGNSITNTGGSTQTLSMSNPAVLSYTALSGGSIGFDITNSAATNGSSQYVRFTSNSVSGSAITSIRESAGNHNLVFETRGSNIFSERMRINPNGNISIGTTSSSSLLTVNGTLAIFGTSTLATTTITNLTLAQALGVTSGGTGLSSYATGDLIYASGANTLAQRTIGATGDVLSVVGGVPTWVATSTLGITGGGGILSTDIDTSSELAAILTDETGSAGGGLVVFSNAPTFTGTSIFTNSSTTNATTTTFAISGLTSGRVPYLTTGGRLIDSANFTFNGTSLTLGTDVSLSRGAANRLDLATGDSINIVNGGLMFAGTTTITAGITNRSYTFGELAGATFTNNTINNIAIGFEAGRFASTTPADDNVYIGIRAGLNNTGRENLIFGSYAGTNNTGFNNFLFGFQAGRDNKGSRNIFFGDNAGVISSGNENTAIGHGSGFESTGSGNSILGVYAGANNAGSYSEFVGYEAGALMSASSSVIIGSLALRGGSWAAYLGNAATTTNNIAIGYGAGYNVQTGGDNNLLLGYQAADSLTTGANNIIIGYDVEAPSNSGSNQLNIGNLIFGNNINGTGTVLSTGNIGIGSTSPSAKLTVAGTFLATGTSTLATTTITDLSIAGVLRDTTNSAGTLGMVLQSTGTSTRWVATSTLGISGGSSFTTSADLAALLSDETGSAGGGLVVFSNAPTFTGTANFASTTNSGRLSVLGTSTLATTSISGLLQMGTTSVASRFNLDVAGFNTAGTAGLNRYYTSTNAASGTVQFGESGYLRASVTATSTIVGSMFRVEDSTTFGNTIRGLEVQTNRGTNTRGENTALSGFARTFGVRGFTSADAGGVFEPAGGYFETGGTTQGNAIRGYSASITSASLASLFQDTSTFSGTGLQMNLGNGSGSFTGKFLDLQVAGVSKFSVASTGATLVLGDLNVNATNTDPADNNVVGMYFGANGHASINRSAGVAMNLGRSNDGSVLEFYSAGAVQGGVSIAGATVSYNAFTGSHFGLTNATTYAQGTVLTLTDENASYNNDPDSEILYGMTESSLENDPKVVGTYLSVLEPALPESTSNPTLVMAVGNGHMWVADQGEDIAAGDYLISSDVAGHAEKDTQSADMSYVIARASEAIDWDEVTDTTIDGVKHKKITIFFENFDRPNLNLAQLASSTFDLTELTDETPTERFLTGLVESLVDWFGNAQNGIGNMYANVFNASERICVDGECLDANDIRDLKEALQNGGSSNPPPANNGGGDSSGDSGDNGGASTDSGDGEGNEGGDSGGEEPPPGDGGEGTGGGEDTGGSSGDSGDGSGGDGGN